MDFSGTREIIEQIISTVAADLGYMIYESSLLLKGSDSRFIIKIDRVEGISHHDCELFSRELIRRLENEDIVANYSLEVSSPGLTRKLQSLDDFIRFKGSFVKIVYNDNNETKVIKGTINNIIDTKIRLKSDNNEIVLDFKNIKKANLEYKRS